MTTTVSACKIVGATPEHPCFCSCHPGKECMDCLCGRHKLKSTTTHSPTETVEEKLEKALERFISDYIHFQGDGDRKVIVKHVILIKGIFDTINPPTETDKTKQCFCQSIYNGETNTVDNCTCGKCVDAIANHTETVKNCKKCYEEKNYGICPHNHSTETVSECRCVCHTDKPWLSPHSSERCLCQKLTPIGPMVKKWEESVKEKVNEIRELIKSEWYEEDCSLYSEKLTNGISRILSHSVQEAKAEMAIRAVDECMKYYENPTYEIRDMILASLKQEEEK